MYDCSSAKERKGKSQSWLAPVTRETLLLSLGSILTQFVLAETYFHCCALFELHFPPRAFPHTREYALKYIFHKSGRYTFVYLLRYLKKKKK